MVNLTINNSYSKISGLSAQQEKGLKSLLTYAVGGKSAYFSNYGPRFKSLLDKRGEFPTGLLSKVKAFLDKNQIDRQIRDTRVRPLAKFDPKFTSTIVPYEAQIEATANAICERRGTIQMVTGSGKSLVIALIASTLKVKTLVVVPSREIKKQLSESLLEAFNDVSWITVENIDSPALKKAKGFDCLIIDEAHHVAAKTYQKLNRMVWTGIYYRFFLTATPFRNDDEETLLFESIAGQVIYSLSYKEAIKKGYIVPVEAYYLEIPAKETDAYTYSQVYSELVVNNEIRNEMIANLALRLEENDVFTLVLVREVAHGTILAAKSGAAFVNGTDEESRDYIRQFNSGEIKTLVGTTGILGEGVDTKPCEYVIIAGLGKAKSQFMQQIGRAVRKYAGKETAKVIIIKDSSHKFTKNHFNTQKKILLEEYGVKVLKLEI
jgi:superfamily II DNA or RNA helicase